MPVGTRARSVTIMPFSRLRRGVMAKPAVQISRETINAGKIAYVTDMHLKSESIDRLHNFCEAIKAASPENRPQIVVLGGDTVDFSTDHWKRLAADPKNTDIWEEIRRDQENFVLETLLPTFRDLVNSNHGMHIVYCPGNVDHYAYEFIKNNPSMFPMISCIDGEAARFGEFTFIGLSGTMAVEPENKPENYKESPALGLAKAGFPGYLTKQRMMEKMETVQKLMRSVISGNVIFISHTPAKGHVDSWNFRGPDDLFHDGLEGTLELVEEFRPMLHLTGHVHDIPTCPDAFGLPRTEYDQEKTHSVIGDATITINPGGDKHHDQKPRIVIVDIETLRWHSVVDRSVARKVITHI